MLDSADFLVSVFHPSLMVKDNSVAVGQLDMALPQQNTKRQKSSCAESEKVGGRIETKECQIQ